METLEDWMLPLDAPVIRIAPGSDHRACGMDSKNIRETELRAAHIVLVIHAGFKSSQQRPASLHIRAQLVTLLVAKQRRVGQDDGGVFAQPLGLQPVFMD